jgi:hypothetical protein
MNQPSPIRQATEDAGAAVERHTPAAPARFPDDYMAADWSMIPEHCQAGLRRHIEDGGEVGDFLTAVLSNNLSEAVMRADAINLNRLRDYMLFLHNFAPPNCFGSAEKVEAWRKAGGLNGGAR